MLHISKAADAIAKAAEHKRIEGAIRAMYPNGGVLGGFMQIGDLMLHDGTEPEAFAAVVGALRKRQAAIEAELAAIGFILKEPSDGEEGQVKA